MSAPGPELNLTPELFQTTVITKTAVRPRLRVTPAIISGKADLEAFAITSELSFSAGINCDTPYGCTDIDYTSSPSLTIIRPPSALPLNPVACTCSINLAANLEIKFSINYRNINTKLKVIPVGMNLDTLTMAAASVNVESNFDMAQNQAYDSNVELQTARGINTKLTMKCCGTKNFDTMPNTFVRTYSQFNSSNTRV